MTAASTLDVMKESYENGELDEYLNNMENIYFIVEKYYDELRYKGAIITISGCKINTVEYEIRDLDVGDVAYMSQEIVDAIDSYCKIAILN